MADDSGKETTSPAMVLLKSLPATFLLINIFVSGMIFQQVKQVIADVAELKGRKSVAADELAAARADFRREIERLEKQLGDERVRRYGDNQLLITYIVNTREKLAERGFKLPLPPDLNAPDF